MAEVGFERVATALDALREAIPALPLINVAQALAVSDTESRQLLEQLVMLNTEILDELRTLNARSAP